MKNSEATLDFNNINPVDLRLLSEQVDIVLRALELYSYNLEYMINGENCTDDEKQKNNLYKSNIK